MKDKLWTICAFFGFVTLCVLYIVFAKDSSSQYVKEFTVNAYYVPHNIANWAQATTDEYAIIGNRRNITCNQVKPVRASTAIQVYSTITNYRHPYSVSYWIVAGADIGTSERSVNINTASSEIQNALKFAAEPFKQTGDIVISSVYLTLWEQYDGVEYDDSIFDLNKKDAQTAEQDGSGAVPTDEPFVYSLCAPFSYKFTSVNTSAGREICIINNDGTVRITYKQVANWFCAGEPYMSTLCYNGTTKDYVPWSRHCMYHNTIIGNTANSDCKGGSAGDVIGYGCKDTTVLIEAKINGSWTSISMENLLKGTY